MGNKFILARICLKIFQQTKIKNKTKGWTQMGSNWPMLTIVEGGSAYLAVHRTALCFTECLKIFVVEVYHQLATNEQKVSITTVNEEISNSAEYFYTHTHTHKSM